MAEKMTVCLYEKVKEMAAATDSLYRDIGKDHDELLAFLDVNSWFGMHRNGSGDELYVSEFEQAETALMIWLKCFRQPHEKKLHLMLEEYCAVFPNTCKAYGTFIRSRNMESVKTSWQLLDYLLCNLTGEITDYTEDAIRDLLDKMDGIMPLSCRRLLMDFLENAEYGVSEWKYRLHNSSVHMDNTAYSMEKFSKMAYCIFNEESWRDNNLLAKAAASKVYANLWLFTALHFVCALRQTDMTALPVPSLPYAPEEIRSKILADAFPAVKAKAIPEEVMMRLRYLPQKPNKTKRHSGIPDLKLFIPESLLYPMGIIMALALSFREETDPFVLPVKELSVLVAFYGNEFAEAAGRKRFMTRRANKAYLQGIELTAEYDESPGKVKGYMLAALARSHKGGIGSLPDITELYLKDASFTGYSPEFILRQMFERGIFGFIPAILMEAWLGKSYIRLGVQGQTELIRRIGLDGIQLERIAELTEQGNQKALNVVGEILQDTGNAMKILQQIAFGNAAARQEECLCLRTAADLPCTSPERSSCIGCVYEIHTKAVVHFLMKEYVRLQQYLTENPGDYRTQLLLRKGIIPTVTVMVSEYSAFSSAEEQNTLLDIVEGGISHAGSFTR